MALPTLITVHGTYIKLDGTPEQGVVQFKSNVYSLDSDTDTVLVPDTITGYLDSQGKISLTLPATNDPDWTPVGWTYTFIAQFSSSYYSFEVVIPYNAPGGSISASELVPAQPANSQLYAAYNHTHTGYLTQDELNDAVDEALAESDFVSDAELTTALSTKADVSTVAGLAPINSPTFTGTVNGITKAMVGLSDVNNTSDANKPISIATQTALNAKVDITDLEEYATPEDLATYAPLASPSFTGTVSGVTKAMVGLGNVDNTSDLAKPISTATQTALDLKLDGADLDEFLTTEDLAGYASSADLATKAPIASPTFTGTVSGITKSMVGLGNVDNTSDANKPVSTATQTALNLKVNTADLGDYLTTDDLTGYAPLASPTFTGTVSGVTKSMVGLANVDNTSDANKPVSDATQTALNLKAPLASPTFTGTVSGITKSMVGLANVDNTSDASKPVSTATQTALDAKVAGAASSTDNQLALFSGTTGKVVKTSAVAIDSNADMTGLRRVTRTLSTDPAVTGIIRWDLNYAVSTTSSDLERIYVSSVMTSWRNEVGFLRGTPHTGYKDDALVRGIPRGDLTSQDGGFVELENSARTQVLYKRSWRTGELWRGNGTAAAVKMSDVLVLGPVDSIPAGTPANTVIVRTE
jgi:hypothetical protein